MDAFGYFFVVQGFLLENFSCSVDVYLPRLTTGGRLVVWNSVTIVVLL